MANNMPAGQAPGPKRVAVIVTHGVGEAEPGEVLRELTKNVGSQLGVTVENQMEVHYVAESVARHSGSARARWADLSKPVAQSGSDNFPVFMRRATLDSGEQLTFAELYWADMTRVGGGRIGAALGIFRVIFEAHYVIDGMLDEERGWVTRFLRLLLLLLSFLMRGPLAASTAVTAAVCAVMLYWPQDFPLGDEPALLAVVTLTLLFLASTIFLVWTKKREELTWATTLGWTSLVSGAGAVIVTVLVTGGIGAAWLDERGDFVNTPYFVLIVGWMIWGGAYLFALLLAFILWFQQRSVLTAVGILALQFTLWTALIGTAVIPLLNRAEEGMALSPVREEISGKISVLSEATKAIDLQKVTETESIDRQEVYRRVDHLWELLGVPKAERDKRRANAPAGGRAWHRWLSGIRRDAERRIGRLEKLSAIPTIEAEWVDRFRFAYGSNGAILLVLFAIFASLFLWRWMLARMGPKGSLAKTYFMPRLLFSGLAITPLVLLTAGLIVFSVLASRWTDELLSGVWLSGWMQIQAPAGANVGEPGALEAFGTQLATYLAAYKYTIMSLALLFGLLLPLFLGRALGNALHIARDLIDHQYGPEEGRALSSVTKGLKRDERWPRRARIEARLASMLATLREQCHFDHVVFVAHSQGTIIVYDYLRNAAPDMRELDGLMPDVLTLGSPLEHIYRHYYHEYADALEKLAGLRPFGRWVNLYRPDDYVGTNIGPDGWIVTNEGLDPGGHLVYWNDRRVAEVILDLARGGQARTRAPDTAVPRMN